MTSKDFLVKNKRLDTHIVSLVQHKIRTVLKCYTVFEFKMNEDKTFTFKKSHKINGVRMNDPKTYKATYILAPFNDEQSKLTITLLGEHIA